MKKIILTIIVVVCVIAVSSAQDERSTDFRSDLQFGMKAGFNYSNVYDSKGEQFESFAKLGLAGGIFLSVPVGKYLGVQPELLFSQKGFQGRGNLLGSAYDITRTTSFVDVPLFFAFKPAEAITILVGPQYSYLIKQRDVFVSSTTSVAQEQVFKNDNFRKNILCFASGIDFNIQHVVIGVRAGWDLQNNNGDGTSSIPRYKNVWYQATVGYRF